MDIVFVTYEKPLIFVPLKDVLQHPCDPEDYDDRLDNHVSDEDIPF
jgi:hypothetical protein